MLHLTLPAYVDSPMLDSPLAVRLESDEATSTLFVTPTLMALRPTSMPRKMFIVARENAAAYRQLLLTVGREPGVEIIYDRRPAPPARPGRMQRLVHRLKRVFGRDGASATEAPGRRKRPHVDHDLRAKGWAVVRVDEDPRPPAP